DRREQASPDPVELGGERLEVLPARNARDDQGGGERARRGGDGGGRRPRCPRSFARADLRTLLPGGPVRDASRRRYGSRLVHLPADGGGPRRTCVARAI